jgi:hypothetical protein
VAAYLYVVETALSGVLGISMKGLIGEFPLGWPAVLLVYAAGAVVSFVALSRPRLASVGMIAVGLCGILFGGPVAKIYGVIMLVAAALCAWAGARSPHGDGARN